MYFLYLNGVIINVNGYVINEGEEEFRKRIIDGSAISVIKRYQYKYGLFQISNNIIKIEKWAPGNGGFPLSFLKDGKILNDTTFVLYNNSKEGEIDTIGNIYHFKQFSPKPDSTNKFIK